MSATSTSASGRPRWPPGLAALSQEEAVVMTETAARTLPQQFLRQVERQGDRLAIRYKAYGIWHRVTWRQYGEEVLKVAAALLAFRLRPQENVAVLADNRPPGHYCPPGVQMAGGATVGIAP